MGEEAAGPDASDRRRRGGCGELGDRPERRRGSEEVDGLSHFYADWRSPEGGGGGGRSAKEESCVERSRRCGASEITKLARLSLRRYRPLM